MERKKLIIDCDPGIDDVLALILAILTPDLDLVGISICGGNCPSDLAYDNARRVLRLLDADIPLIRGLDGPKDRPLDTAPETHGEDGFGEVSRDFDQAYPQAKDYLEGPGLVDFYRQALEEGGDLSLVALGPMTNVAHILSQIPDHFAKFDRVISMGGAYKSHGNSSPLAEFNYWVDPEAASYVFNHAPQTLEMVGLDVTRDIVLNEGGLRTIEAINPELGAFIRDITRFYFDFHWAYEGIEGCVINDPLALAALLDPGILEGFEAHVDVASSGLARGLSVVDDHDFLKTKPNALVYTQVDPVGFFNLFYRALAGGRR